MAYGNGGTIPNIGGAGLAGYSGPMDQAMPPRGGQVAMHATELHQALGELANRIDGLEKTLSPILTPAGPSTASGSGANQAAQRSQIADSFAGATQMVVQLLGRLDYIASRVEL